MLDEFSCCLVLTFSTQFPMIGKTPNQCGYIAIFGTASIAREATNIISMIVRVLEIVL
jgi:hypothetical protein